jgi:hypothetical protein
LSREGFSRAIGARLMERSIFVIFVIFVFFVLFVVPVSVGRALTRRG